MVWVFPKKIFCASKLPGKNICASKLQGKNILMQDFHP
jgi:hypothetical protein